MTMNKGKNNKETVVKTFHFNVHNHADALFRTLLSFTSLATKPSDMKITEGLDE